LESLITAFPRHKFWRKKQRRKETGENGRRRKKERMEGKEEIKKGDRSRSHTFWFPNLGSSLVRLSLS